MTDEFDNREKFEIALEARYFEIEMFWRRNNYFLLLNTSVGVGAGTAAIEKGYGPFLFFCVIGIFVCIAWAKVGLGAKFWQVHWETVVAQLQKEVGFSKKDKTDFFSQNEQIYKRVKRGLRNKKGFNKKSFLYKERSLYKRCVLEKPSVSRWMHATAYFFLIAWMVAGGYALITKFEPSETCSPCLVSSESQPIQQ